jgi:energy-coupling factor transporter transmembrane protein EcfT
MAEIDDLREELERLKATEEKSDKADKIQMTSGDIVRLVIAAPVVFCWLFLGSRIIISATTSTAVLEHIEPLLLALSILTIPVTGILASLFKVDGNGK